DIGWVARVAGRRLPGRPVEESPVVIGSPASVVLEFGVAAGVGGVPAGHAVTAEVVGNLGPIGKLQPLAQVPLSLPHHIVPRRIHHRSDIWQTWVELMLVMGLRI